MPLKEVIGQPGLFRDTLNGDFYNVRDLPITDPRLSPEVLSERYRVALIAQDGIGEKAIAALVQEIEAMEFPSYVRLSPSYLQAIAHQAEIIFLTQVAHAASKKVVENYGDAFNFLFVNAEEEEEE